MDVNAETQVAVNSVPENGNPDCTISFSILWKAASASLKGHWGSSILACLVAMIITMAVNQIPFAVLVSGIFFFRLPWE